MNKKQIVRLTESDIHRIVKESVNKILREGWELDYDDNGYITNLPDDVAEWGAKCQQLGSELSTLCGKYRYENEELYQMLRSLALQLNAVNGDLNAYSIASHWER